MSAPILVLVPTALERRRLERLEQQSTAREDLVLATCGFGPVAAAASTAGHLVRGAAGGDAFARVVLVGIAGSYDPGALPLGAAATFAEVALADLGAGRGDSFQGPTDLDLPQWDGPPGPVHERLPLAPGLDARRLLLTVPAASGDAAHAAERRARFPDATAEDMEAFGVALACHQAQASLTVVRGISNLVGDRDHARWRIAEALAAAEDLTLELVATP